MTLAWVLAPWRRRCGHRWRAESSRASLPLIHRSGWFAQDAKVPPPGPLGGGRSLEGRVGGALARRLFRGGRPACRLTDGVGQGQQVIRSGAGGGCRHGEAEDL